MWTIIDQETIEQLNEAVNEQWKLVAYLQSLSRWNGLKKDIVKLRENIEAISELLCEAIVWVGEDR